MTYAIAGLRTWQVYTDAELDAVPWATLGAGDVVNIYHRAEPYRKIIRVRAKGTEALPVIINGVTDANGNRPVFHGQNATVATGCVTNDSNSLFNPTNPDAWQYREAIGLIGTANGLTDPYDQQWPEHVQWLNLEITGCKDGNAWTDARGVSHTWNQASGFRVQNGKWIVVDNCVIHGNDFGYFTQSQGPTEGTATQNPVVRNSRIYGNGMVNRYTEHNMYVQGQGPLIEGNFIGGLIPGALGSAYKSRATGEVFRYNTVLAAQRLVDFVEPEEQAQGLNLRADQPFVHCYGNLFVNDFSAPGGGAVQAIHIGQDKWIEEGGSGSAQVTDADLVMTKSDGQGGAYQMTAAPRHTLFFYNNTVIFRGTTAQTWRANIFDLSLAGTATRPRTTVHEWNNAYKLIGNINWALVEYAGHVEHRGGSLWDVGSGMALHHDNADPSRVSTNGTRPAASLAVDTAAWSLTVPAGTPYTPANMPAGWRPELATVDRQPAGFGFNGTVSRASVTKAGAFE